MAYGTNKKKPAPKKSTPAPKKSSPTPGGTMLSVPAGKHTPMYLKKAAPAPKKSVAKKGPKFLDDVTMGFVNKKYGSKQMTSADVKKNPKLAQAYEKTYGSSWGDQLDNANLYGMSDKTMRRLSGNTNTEKRTAFQKYMKENPKANPLDTAQMKRANIIWGIEGSGWSESKPKSSSKKSSTTKSKTAPKKKSK